MKRRYYLLIFLAGLLIRMGVAALLHSPGFMDAEYYFIGGRHLAQGDGFNEEILWNFLDDPTGLPHPSHGYWMPLTSILAASGMVLSQSPGFTAAQIVFVLIGSLFPPLTAYLCFQLTYSRGSALLAGGIAILPVFYLPYMTTSDTFGIYAVLGTSFFILLSESFSTRRFLAPFLLGTIAGLMHLSRADGIIWLGFAILSTLYIVPQNRKRNANLRSYIEAIFLVTGGYLVIMAPWFMRNFSVFGSPTAPGSMRALWITNYNELYIFPASILTPERWLATGWESILEARTWALKINLQRSFAEQGMIFLAPLILLGLWQYRKDFRIKLGAFIWLCTFVAMTLVFPYQGARGGFFHSSAALLGFLWTAGAAGLNAILLWAHRTINWKVREPKIVFSIMILFFALVLSVFIVSGKIISREGNPPQWEENKSTYQSIEAELVRLGALPSDIVLTTNAPGYFAYTNRSAISIPDGTPQTVLEVAEKYKASYLVLEKDHPKGLDNLFDNPKAPPDGLQYLMSIGTTHIFSIH